MKRRSSDGTARRRKGAACPDGDAALFVGANGGRILFVAGTEIDWIGAEGNYARLHVARNVFDVRETLQALTEKLDPREFVLLHRSTIVNVRRIREVQPWFQGSHIVLLQSGEELTMSRYQRAAVERLLGKG